VIAHEIEADLFNEITAMSYRFEMIPSKNMRIISNGQIYFSLKCDIVKEFHVISSIYKFGGHEIYFNLSLLEWD